MEFVTHHARYVARPVLFEVGAIHNLRVGTFTKEHFVARTDSINLYNVIDVSL